MRLLGVLFLVFTLGAAPQAVAQGDYPSRPIRLVVTFAAGGGNDILARLVAAKLQTRWGQPVVVENKPGAGGNIGADCAAIALLASTPFAPVTNNDVPAKSVGELVAHAKANPGKLSFASVGIGTPHHLGMELFKSLTGTDMVHVSYKGSVPALTDTATGQTQVMLVTINAAMPFLQGQKIRPLGVGERARVATLRDVPTVIEAGVAGFEVSAWYAILAPAGTPPDIQRRLTEAVLQSIGDPDTKEKLAPAGFEITPGSPADLRALIATDYDKWARVVAGAGLKPE